MAMNNAEALDAIYNVLTRHPTSPLHREIRKILTAAGWEVPDDAEKEECETSVIGSSAGG